MATWLLSRAVDAHDPRERGNLLREARATLQLAEQVATADPDSHTREISDHIKQLKDRLEAAYWDSSPR